MSGFLVAKASDKVTLLARLDRMLDPNPDGPKIPYLPFAATAKSTFLLAGVDVTLDRRFHLIPNIETVLYDKVASGPKPDADVMLRATFSITF